MTSRLFYALIRNDLGFRALSNVLSDVFPWVRFLPAGEQRDFLVELVETVHASAALGNMAAAGALGVPVRY